MSEFNKPFDWGAMQEVLDYYKAKQRNYPEVPKRLINDITKGIVNVTDKNAKSRLGK